MTLLDVRGIHVAYGSVHAIRDLSLSVHTGEMVCLIGANGAGKSTVLKAIAGIQAPSTGVIHYAGHSLARMPAHERAQKGIALVPEGRGIFVRLDVMENLQLGAYCRSDTAVDDDIRYVFDLFPRLAERSRQIAGTLSGGEQQMLAIARALMGRPRLLLLDEPSMGLAPIMVQKIFEIIRRIASDGVTILLVEQNARLALAASKRGYVMESGRIALADTAPALLANPEVQNLYLGGAVSRGDGASPPAI
ncbi:MAG: ABC transporter ATP-binding protein [Gammaproteobacteria bacterium]|nr:ABC transporter ATP-binding protein [Gammaproteobacteria bacterium]